MPGYTVVWEMEIFDADSPEEAARMAHEVVREPNTAATHYTVFDVNGDRTQVNVAEED